MCIRDRHGRQEVSSEFQRLYTGRLWSVLAWNQLTELWQRIDRLLRDEHRESFCGIVYADDLQNPRLIKIYDPNNLGSSCGSSKNPPGPGWIMSRLPPEGLGVDKPPPAGRRRWWRALFGDS